MKMEKVQFEELKIELISFTEDDVIRTSGLIDEIEGMWGDSRGWGDRVER